MDEPVIGIAPANSGGPGIFRIRRSLPAISMVNCASPLMVIISSEPMFTGPVKEDP